MKSTQHTHTHTVHDSHDSHDSRVRQTERKKRKTSLEALTNNPDATTTRGSPTTHPRRTRHDTTHQTLRTLATSRSSTNSLNHRNSDAPARSSSDLRIRSDQAPSGYADLSTDQLHLRSKLVWFGWERSLGFHLVIVS
ncbi:hypothetical protein M758_4G182700 [Ceratodon purpureus]|nr:hypothetical protein M758_4G182700 [Ceratodon purpureus]